jgi:hypothetical protein
VHTGLDSLFEQVLSDAKHYHGFRNVLGAIVFLQDMPYISMLPHLLSAGSVDDIQVALRGCLSILLIPDNDADYIRLYHALLLDFLTNPNRWKESFYDPAECNTAILHGRVNLMAADLESDASALRYAYQNWTHHINMALSYVKDVTYIESNLEPIMKVFSTDVFWLFKNGWLV